ncbi:MAG: hypothetical protein ACLR8Y_03310 [Alistipes indistinctus]
MSSDLFKRKDVSTSKTYLNWSVNSGPPSLAHVFQALQAVGIPMLRSSVPDVSEYGRIAPAGAEPRQPKPPSRMRRCCLRTRTQKAGKALFVQDYSYSARPYANIMMAKSAVMDMAAEAMAARRSNSRKLRSATRSWCVLSSNNFLTGCCGTVCPRAIRRRSIDVKTGSLH